MPYTITTDNEVYPDLNLYEMIAKSHLFHVKQKNHTVIMYNGPDEIERIDYTY